jgi:hypothetical protein
MKKIGRFLFVIVFFIFTAILTFTIVVLAVIAEMAGAWRDDLSHFAGEIKKIVEEHERKRRLSRDFQGTTTR